jgi:hypothetical protein
LPLKEAPQPSAGESHFVEAVQQGLEEPGAVFVGYEPSVEGVNRRARELALQAFHDAGRRPRLVRLIRDAQTRPRFEILAVE